MQWTIKRKLLALGAATFLPLLGLLVFWAWWETSRSTEEGGVQAGLASLQAAQMVEHEIGHVLTHLDMLAARMGSQRGQELEALLRATLAERSSAENLFALAADGRVLAAAVPATTGGPVGPAGRRGLEQALATGQPVVGDLDPEVIRDEQRVSIIVPIRPPAKGAVAALVAVVSPVWIEQAFQPLPLPVGMTITGVDGGGRILFHLPGEAGRWTGRPLASASALPAGPAVVTDAAGVGEGSRLAGVAPIAGTRWRVLVGISHASLKGRLWGEMRAVALPLGALLIVSALAGLLVARRVWRPLATLTEAVGRYAPGDFAPFPARSTDEVGVLGQAFNEMAAQIGDFKVTVERQLAELRALSEAGRLLTGTLEVSEVLSRFADLVSHRLDVEVVRIWLLDDASGEVRLCAQSGATRLQAHQWRVPRGRGLVGWIIERREPVVLPDLRTDSRLIDQPWLEQEGFVSYLGVPIMLKDLTVGGLVCLSRRARNFSAEDVALAQTFALPAAVAIRNARLYGEARASAQALAARSHQLELLHETARTMTAEIDIERLLERIAEHTRRMLGARYGALLVSDDDGRVSRFVTAGLDPEEREQMGSLQQGPGLLGHVVDHGALRLDDLSAHPAAAGFPPGHPSVRSLLAVPIRHRERVLGALYLTEKPGGFTEDDEAILTAVAADAAVAIENSTLVKKLRDALHDLEEAQGRLARAEALRAAGEMAAGVAHHLNNALTVIQGRAELALSTVDDPRLRHSLEVVQRSAGHAATLVRQMQELTGAPSAREVFLVDLSELARQAVEQIQARWKDLAEGRDISISIEASTEAGQIAAVAGDPVSLTRMIEDLLLNAVEATPDRGQVTVRTWASGGTAHCAVTDTGAGMSEDERKRALEPFFTTKGPKRAGLGLSVSHGVVQRHRGTLGIESAPGRGTTVTISLPAAPATPDAGPAPGGPVIGDPAGTRERRAERAG